MPHSGNNIPVISNCWRTLTTKALAEGRQIPSEGKLEIARRGVATDQILYGDDYDRAVWLFRIGFNRDQIAEALSLHPRMVRTFLSSFRGSPSEIVELHLKGEHSAHQIARLTGFSPPYVYRVLDIHGMKPLTHVAAPLNEETKKDVLRRYRRGESVPTIVELTGASEGQIKYLVKANRSLVGYR